MCLIQEKKSCPSNLYIIVASLFSKFLGLYFYLMSILDSTTSNIPHCLIKWFSNTYYEILNSNNNKAKPKPLRIPRIYTKGQQQTPHLFFFFIFQPHSFVKVTSIIRIMWRNYDFFFHYFQKYVCFIAIDRVLKSPRRVSLICLKAGILF